MSLDWALLSPTQAGLLSRVVHEGASESYITQIVCRLDPALDRMAFEHAWQALTTRHQALRCSIDLGDARSPRFVAYDRVDCPFEDVDWEPLPEPAFEERFRRFLLDDRRRGFDLARPPLHRVQFITCGADDFLVWTNHHVVLDGRSVAILLRELTALYDAHRRGEPPQLPSPSSYTDYLRWSAANSSCNGKQYWRDLLNAAQTVRGPEPLRLPKSHDAQFAQARIPLSITAEDLSSTAAACDVTVNTLLQATWAMVLAKYSGNTDVIFGATRACRTNGTQAFRDVVGLRANTTPVRVQSAPTARVRDVLRALRIQHLSVRPFEADPLSSIRRWTEASVDAELFNTLVVFERQGLANLVCSTRPSWFLSLQHIGFTHYDLTFIGHVHPAPALRIDYRNDSFDVPFAERLAVHLGRVIEQVTSAPDRRVGELTLLTPEERRQMIAMSGTTGCAFPYGTVTRRFEAQVLRTPTAIAVATDTEAVTYAELNMQVNQLAHHLMSLGSRDGRLGVCLERSIGLVTAILATMKAGAAYVPLDSALPPERLSFMLEDAAVTGVITTSILADRLGPLPCPAINVDRLAGVIAEQAPINPEIITSDDAPLYLIYTSGSTGRPKGIPVPHRGVANLVDWYATVIRQPATTLQYASVSFDMASYEIFTTLCGGGCLVVVPEETRRDVRRLCAAIDRHAVEVAMLPGVVVDQVAHYCSDQTTWLPTLRDVISAGEQLHITPTMAAFFRRAGGRLHNHYGPSETGPIVITHTLTGEPEQWPARPPIGRPVANTEAYVVDSENHLLPVDVVGELIIAGPGLAKGYWQRATLTAERFRPHPFSYVSDQHVYHTGDMARWRRDGTLEFLGRRDHQIKLRGYRIELGEIEGVLQEHPAIARCAVVACPDQCDRPQLAAYLEPAAGAEVTTADIDTYLRTRLPDYMVPSGLIVLDHLPLTASGKVDRQRLPLPVLTRDSSKVAFVAPRTPVEDMLATIWAEALGVSRVGVHDDFFALGGHSLTAMRVVNRVQSVFPVSCSLAALFRSPTIARFANVILSSGVDLPHASRTRVQSQ